MCDHINEKDYGHKPVLLHECLDALAIRPDGVYVDGTLGRAGHSLEIVRRLTEGGRLIGIDRDQTAIDAAQERLAPYLDRVTLVHSNFDRIGDILADLVERAAAAGAGLVIDIDDLLDPFEVCGQRAAVGLARLIILSARGLRFAGDGY